MRILVWASTFGHTIGGGPVLAPLLFDALAERGHDVLVLTDQRPLSLPAEEMHGAVRVLRFPFRSALGGDSRLFVKLRQRISGIKADYRADLVHIFSPGYSELFHHLTETAARPPLVVTLHDAFSAKSFQPDAIVGRDVRAASWVTTCSSHVLQNARHFVPAITDRSSVILNALPFPGVVRQTPPPDRPEILFVGRLETIKGVDLALRAIGRLRDRMPATRLTIAGSGDNEASLKRLAGELGIASRVTFLGSLDRAAVFECMARCSMVVMPSRMEPFGLVALEAAQIGCPVIATKVGGLPEVVVDGETGLLVPPEDVDALAVAILSLMDSPAEAMRLGQRARDRALNAFSWRAHVSAFDDLFHELARP